MGFRSALSKARHLTGPVGVDFLKRASSLTTCAAPSLETGSANMSPSRDDAQPGPPSTGTTQGRSTSALAAEQRRQGAAQERTARQSGTWSCDS
ncbi:hypothetical protein NDU88_000682 [Pleurodeles waltl]|uniref:Uncharacterized protein n=1 Tax=Pleurodeles waltl TaxID=8319 RepID=A0AAV7KNZ8_PLEWA|nr:hypothetical protein NDU88_000682 [Pleurodeles waltl]